MLMLTWFMLLLSKNRYSLGENETTANGAPYISVLPREIWCSAVKGKLDAIGQHSHTWGPAFLIKLFS